MSKELKEPTKFEYDSDNTKDRDMFETIMDGVYPPIMICGMEHSQISVLKVIDETAYNETFNDWSDGEPERWECPECGDIFDDENDAKYCCQSEDNNDD